jgi:hypothetical protein
MVFRTRMLAILSAVATIGAGCARYSDSAAGDVIDASEAAKTVVLHVNNRSSVSMELHAMNDGRSIFVGSVGPSDSTDVLLDPILFPTATLYLVGIPADGHGRAVAGPIAASKGDQIDFNIQSAYDLSRATVHRR